MGPVKLPPKARYQELVKQHAAEESSEEGDENDATLSSLSEDDDEAEEPDVASDDSDEEGEAPSGDDEAALAQMQEAALTGAAERSNKKRKRGAKDEDVEDVYMQKIAREEAKEEEDRKKKRKTKLADVEEGDAMQDSDEESFKIPKHETLVGTDGNDDEVEKAARTVFLGNVSSEAITSKSAEKQLKQHLSSFIEDLADNKPPHKVESIRFRSTAFAGALPKRAAFAKREIMDSTTKSTNCLLYTSPSPRDGLLSRMPSSA